MSVRNTVFIDGKKVCINDGIEIVFEHEVCQLLDMGAAVVVLTMPRHGYAVLNDIYGIINYKIAWQIQDVKEYDPTFPFIDPYVGIGQYYDDPSLVVATNFGGFRFLIDPLTGKIVGRASWVK